MDLHKAELKAGYGSIALNAQLFGNAAELKLVRAGAVTAVLKALDQKNPEQLDVVVTITPAKSAAKPVASKSVAWKPAPSPFRNSIASKPASAPHPLSK